MERGKRQALSSFFGGAGFYIALLLCVVATGVGGYFALFGGDKAEEESGDSPVTNQVISPQEPVIQTKPDVKEETPVSDEVTQTSKPVVVAVPEDTETVEPVQETAHVVVPLNGEVTAVFSMEELQYNETLGDWRTHDGIDIQAAAGTVVAAASAGTVVAVETGGKMGTTVVISHPDGYETTYASLEETVAVETGDTVIAGQEIGTVGNTSLTESAMGAHLHFAVTKDGEAIDPTEYLPS